MYLEYYGLKRLPFSIAPDPDSLYLSREHQEALAHLQYSLSSHGGLVCLTGEVGTGKTTLCRAFIESAPDNVDIAYLFNPNLSPIELIQAICDELGVQYDSDANNKQMVDGLYHSLLERYAAGRKIICIIDEAQTMPKPLLEQVRLLTNLETNKEKLLTLILVGQPELQDLVNSHEMRQFSQRITARCHLNRIPETEVSEYLQCRLQLAGCETNLFEPGVARLIWKKAQGIPRLINSIADRALLGGFANGLKKPDKKVIVNAAKEVLPQSRNKEGFVNGYRYLLLLPLLLLSGLLAWSVGPFSEWDFIDSSEQKLIRAYGLQAESCAALAVDAKFSCVDLKWRKQELQHLKRSLLLFDRQTLITSGSQLPKGYEGSVAVIQSLWNKTEPVIEPGQSHPLIPWVKRALKQVGIYSDWNVISPQGQELLNNNEFYDPLLAMDIEAFQRKYNLQPDKIIGFKTLLILKDQSGVGLD